MSDVWYYADRSERIGPVSASALKATLANMPNAAGVYVWRAGFTDWKRAGEVSELWGDGSAPPPFAPAGAAGPAQYAVTPYVQPNILELWFSFAGRFNRAKLWLVGLVNLGIIMVAAGIAYALGTIGWIIFGLIYLAALVAGLASVIKRLHDRDKSGWWSLVFYVVPAVLSGAGAALGHVVSAVVGLISLGIYIWAFVELGCLRGTQGDNRFGPDPLSGQP